MNTCWASLALRSGLLGAVALGCNSTGVGNPGASASLSMAIVADDEPALIETAASDAGALETPLPRGSLRHAVLVLGAIRWLPCSASESVRTSMGPFVVDLMTGETRPQLPEVEVPEGGLCGFDAPLTPARDSAELAGRSLFFSGERADGVPFLLFADMLATLRVRAHNGETWGENESLSLLWALQPRRWASLMELETAQDALWDARRIVLIDINRNPLLYAAIRSRLAGRSAVFVDDDRDGFLDDDERAAPSIGMGRGDTAE